METIGYKLEDISHGFFYGSMPQEQLLCDSGYPVFSGYRYTGYYREYNIPNRSIVVVARGVGGTGDVRIVEAKTFLTNLSIAVDIDTTIADIDYLKYYLNIQGLRYLDSGAAQSQITINSLKKHKVFLPELKIQKQIVSVLSAYDSLIEVNNKRTELLEQMAENLYKEWFVRFRFPGHETIEFENGIPKEWTIKRIDEVSYIKAGGDRPDVFSEVPTLDMSIPIFSNGIDNEGLYGFTNAPVITAESVTISARGTVGYVFLRRVPFVPIVRLIAVVPNIDIINSIYLYYYLQFDSVIANGTSQQQITVPMVSRKRIIVPPMDILTRFSGVEHHLWDEMDKLKEKNNNLMKQRDLLLPRLMSGKLEV